MHEIIHQWSDGYGAELRFVVYPGGPSSVEGIANTRTAYIAYDDNGTAGGYLDVTDLRAIAAAASAAADLMEGS